MDKKRKKASQPKLSTFGIQVENEIPVLERIKYPIIWERITTGYRIQDLQPSKIEYATDIIKAHYFNDEPLCQGLNLVNNKAAVEEYINLITYWLKDTQSLAAVEEGTGVFVGVLIGRVFDRTLRAQSRMTSLDSFTLDSGDKRIDNVEEVECPPLPCRDTVRPASFSFKQRTPKSKDGQRYSESKPKKSIIVGKREKSVFMDRGEKSVFLDTKEKSFTMDKNEKNLLMDRKEKSSKSLRGASVYSTASTDEKSLKRKQPMFDDDHVVYESPLLMKIHRLKSHLLRKVDILTLFDAITYFSIHLLIVIPDHRGKGVARALLRSAMDMSKKFGCDVVSGIFTDTATQNIAHVEGFKVLDEIVLSDWLENDVVVFSEINSGAYSANVMAIRIEDPPPPILLPPSVPPKRRTRVH